MEVLLHEDVKNVGKAGQVVKVSEGYARNFLLPSNKAVVATKRTIEAMDALMKKKTERAASDEAKLKETAGKMNGLEIKLKKKAGDDGKLFGSVSEAEIAAAVAEKGFKIAKKKVALNGHLKDIGTSEVTISLKHGIEARIKVTIEKESGKKG